jgi:hypothetical protein
MRQNDQALIDEALGIKPKRQKHYDDLDQTELKALLAKGTTERGSLDVERVQGLGAAPAKFHDHIERYTPRVYCTNNIIAVLSYTILLSYASLGYLQLKKKLYD